jgi:hypothetical protein
MTASTTSIKEGSKRQISMGAKTIKLKKNLRW